MVNCVGGSPGLRFHLRNGFPVNSHATSKNISLDPVDVMKRPDQQAKTDPRTGLKNPLDATTGPNSGVGGSGSASRPVDKCVYSCRAVFVFCRGRARQYPASVETCPGSLRDRIRSYCAVSGAGVRGCGRGRG